ncbi:type VI secretion system baseplate subunit TssE [Acidomonas methanolica]|uniref:type VI secretion system baseplate subunit TssE n=1 Tax=Acidomonas methanolica TaxID=437 RepID=UPI00211A4E6C|nr:type VI secretion system baseplate subunit TssE [Acidomonas methanolica]
MRSPALATLSVLDRLLDDRPGQASDPPSSGPLTLGRMRASVRRDLEALLNATRPWIVPAPHHAELTCSPLGYGLEDVTARVLSNESERERIRAEVETTIRRFDPRLTDVRATLLPDDAPLSTAIRLRIDAVLLIDPAAELVRYSTAILPPGQAISVRALHET